MVYVLGGGNDSTLKLYRFVTKCVDSIRLDFGLVSSSNSFFSGSAIKSYFRLDNSDLSHTFICVAEPDVIPISYLL